MTRDFTCSQCGRQFRVLNEIPALPCPEVPVKVLCPTCKTPHRIAWPTDARIIVIPK